MSCGQIEHGSRVNNVTSFSIEVNGELTEIRGKQRLVHLEKETSNLLIFLSIMYTYSNN